MLATKVDRLIFEICERYISNCLTKEEFLTKGKEILRTLIKKSKKKGINYSDAIKMVDFIIITNLYRGKRINTDLVIENFLKGKQEIKILQQHNNSIYALYQTAEVIKVMIVLCKNYDYSLYELLI